MEEHEKPQAENTEPTPKGVYGPNDKPKGQATVVQDDPIEVFPVDNGDIKQPPTE